MSLPEITETPVNAPYWQALRAGRLDYQACDDCGRRWLPARAACPACLSPRTQWRPASGRGRVLSWVVYHKAYAPHLAGRLPYNVALVELEEGPRLLTNITGDPGAERLFPDMPVMLQIETDLDLPLPRFRPAGD